MNDTYIQKLVSLETSFGNTPMLEIVLKYKGVLKTIYAKEEYFSPTGSIKVRPAYQILLDAIKDGRLKEGQTVVEVTSGNMGISLAYFCKKIGNPINIYMPSSMSIERVQKLKEFGANVILTKDFLEAFNCEQEEIAKGSFASLQFDNVSNLKSHKITANEILSKVEKFDAFVSGVGTGGTLIGVGTELKNRGNYKVIAIDPSEAMLLTNGKSNGKHKIQGLSDQIIPSLYNKDIVDEIVNVGSDDSICVARALNKKFNIHIGISSGANVLGCLLSEFKTFTTVFADDDSKYLSTDLYNEDIQSDLIKDIEFISIKKVE